MRKKININDNWKFIKQDEVNAWEKVYEDTRWQKINLPHTWNSIDGANGNSFYKGACWYRKSFVINESESDKRIYIEFEGSNSITDVYINGNHIGQHKGGYSTFRFDITEAIKYGSNNILAVKVDNTVVEDVYPTVADFTFYGGIYRNVNIVIADKVHFDLLDYGSSGVYITQEKVTDKKALIKITARLTNDNQAEKKLRLWGEVLNAENKAVTYMAHEIIVSGHETQEVDLKVEIDNPILWDGRKNPYLYKLRIYLSSYNDILDELNIPFGVRYFLIDAEDGFFLNGKHLSLKGVSRHQDRKDMGWAIGEEEQLEDMKLIKEIGATSIRLAHYQHNSFFYDLCDKEGMVVWAEIPFISVMSKKDLEGKNAKQQLLELIKQNFNHASIFFWGIQNEIQIGGDRPEVRKLVKDLNKLTKEIDPTRLSTMANVGFVDKVDEYNYITDVIGFNHYFGWYSGECENFSEWLDNYHKTNPEVALCISEYGAEGIIEYHSEEPKVKDYSEEYHALLHEKVWNIFEGKTFLWGTYVWNMFDFGANIRDEGGVKGRNNKGLVTYDRKIKKDAFYMYKAYWSEEKFVHIASKRFIERTADKIQVKVYSNCSTVALYINDLLLETKTKSPRIFIFENVKLQNGINKVKAVGDDKDEILSDIAIFLKVSEENKSYVAPVEDIGNSVDNWFQTPDLREVVLEELEITDEVYSTRCSFRELMDCHEAKAVIRKYLGKIDEHPSFAMAMEMSIDNMARLANSKEIFNEKMIYVLNSELTKIKKL